MKPADISLLHALGAPTISPDGKHAIVAVTRPDLEADEYRGGLWLVPTDGFTEPRRLTRGPRDGEPAYSPDGAWLAFVRGGDGAKPQLYVMPTGGGEPRKVTDEPLGVSEPVWSPDSRRLAFVARVPEEGRYGENKPEKERPRRITGFKYRRDNLGFFLDRRSHVFVVDPFAEEPSATQITEGDFDHDGVTWSPDGALLAFVAARHDERGSTLTNDVWVSAPDGSDLRRVTATDLAVAAPRFTPDGDALCFLGAGAGPEGRHLVAKNFGLWLMPLAGGAARRLTDEERFHLPVTPYVPTTDGVLVTVENRGAKDLLHVPYTGAEPTVLINGPREVDAVAHAADVTVVAVADARTPGELVALHRDKEITLTSFGPGLDVLPVEEVTGTAPDGYPVHGWIVRPAGEGPHPVLLMIHGGPFAQYGWHVFDEAQIYASAGYAVVMGNPRGSSGYGQAHGRHVFGDVGRLTALDLLALFDAALATGGLDASRAGVLGGSHGGFMTTWMAAHHGDRFKAAISERAVNAIDSFHGSSDIGWSFARDLYGEDPARWVEQSPLTHADKIDKPFMIIHSEHDWRCPVEQAQRLFVKLQLRGVETELLLFPGEGHELSRSGLPSHRVARFDAILDWWGRHL
ncbi:S9 family peptidase [Microtetraspora malaysiensis]|uniref:S9 family peptidase n=1 Tax=Microtetraspora malaysiensis TaxID=161358 RepID=UPI000835F134|nr:S9 family peptidase [Microtetraspora malaysiensis]